MNGILLVDKPAGWTSSDVVVKLRGILHERRIGHAGTLDPMATGLLTVFVGRATRAVEYAEAGSKRYTAGLKLGTVTDTQDTTGAVLSVSEANISDTALNKALEAFCGEQQQLPPMYSAVKLNGQRLYDIARKGGEVERKPRRIEIFALALLKREGADCTLDVRCSKGTYIRTLCHDIGAYLGCGGCMSALRRTEACGFSIENAYTLEEISAAASEGRAQELLLPVDTLFADRESCTADAEQEKKLRVGAQYRAELPDGEYRVYSEGGEFLMLGVCSGGVMKTGKSFFEV